MSNNEVKSIIQEVQYGIINIKLDDVMNKRGISTYELSNKANVRFQTIKSLRENTATRIDFEVLAKICYALDIDVKDVMEYAPNNKNSKE